MASPVKVTQDGPVAVIQIANPPLNLLTMAIRAELERVATRIRSDSSVRAVVLRATGDRSFSAGSDIREFPDTPEAGRNRAVHEHACYDAIADLPQPVIGALFGHVLGAGLELALACDLRIADRTSHLGLPEVKLGVFPSGAGTQRLPRVVGSSRAKRMMFLAEILPAQAAMDVGLVDEVVPAGDAAAAALRLAHQLAAQPRLGIQAIKKAVDHGLKFGSRAGQAVEVELIGQLFTSHDAREGVRAFLESRPPAFIHD